LFKVKKQENIMKIYALLIVMSLAMAGCSTSLKGSVGAAGNQDASKNGSSVASHTGVIQPVAVTGN
jgi:PBP1b-binding outer membrane lipoprotein LpoB